MRSFVALGLAPLLAACGAASPTPVTWHAASMELVLPPGWEALETDDTASTSTTLVLERGDATLNLELLELGPYAEEEQFWDLDGVARCDRASLRSTHVGPWPATLCTLRATEDEHSTRVVGVLSTEHSRITLDVQAPTETEVQGALDIVRSASIDQTRHASNAGYDQGAFRSVDTRGDIQRRWAELAIEPQTLASDKAPTAPADGLIELREAHPANEVWAWIRPAPTKSTDRPAVLVFADTTSPRDSDAPFADLLALDAHILFLRAEDHGPWHNDPLYNRVLALARGREVLRSRSHVQQDRIYAVGTREGGRAALLHAALEPGLRAVMSADGISWVDMHHPLGAPHYFEQLTTPALLLQSADGLYLPVARLAASRATHVGATVQVVPRPRLWRSTRSGIDWTAALIAADSGSHFSPTDQTLDTLRQNLHRQALAEVRAHVREGLDAFLESPFHTDLVRGTGESLEAMGQFLPNSLIEPVVRETQDQAIAAKREQESTWPELTDCDKLDSALRRAVSETRSVGEYCRGEDCARFTPARSGWRVSIWYSAADVPNTLRSGRLPLYVWPVDDPSATELRAAFTELQRELRRAGLQSSWSGDLDEPVWVTVKWQRRLPR